VLAAVLIARAPKGMTSFDARVQHVYSDNKIHFSRYALGNLLPEGDQLMLGFTTMTMFDPLLTVSQARVLKRLTTTIYRELEIDPHNVLAKYKLGVLTVEKGDGKKGKELIEAALQAKSDLLHSDYNLGRAEMLLGNNTLAVQRLERATSAPGSDPEVIQQAWYQLGIVYRRLHRMEDAQKAMATFQRLKAEEAENSQKTLRRYEAQQNPNVAQPPPSPENPQ